MALSYLILTVAAIIIVYPLLWVVGTSLNPREKYYIGYLPK